MVNVALSVRNRSSLGLRRRHLAFGIDRRSRSNIRHESRLAPGHRLEPKRHDRLDADWPHESSEHSQWIVNGASK